MIKADELMIGNFVTYFGTFTEICLDDYAKHGHEMPFKPIRLNEDWMKAFGFEKHDNVWIMMNETDGGIDLSANQYEALGPVYCNIRYPFRYVHQLQNYYYAKTMKRLKLVGGRPNV